MLDAGGIRDLMVDASFKGFPKNAPPMPLAAVGAQGWRVHESDLPMPVAVLRESAITHNSQWMRAFLARTGALIAPHGKTTMSPQLYERQLADGAWAITVATVNQIAICRRFAIQRVLLANQLVDRPAIRYVLDELHRDPDFDFYCLVDSPAGVARLAEEAAGHPLARPVQLLVEGGMAGMRTGCRTGCRTLAEMTAVARAVADAAPHVVLCGVEGYEGVVAGGDASQRRAKIDAFLDFLVTAAVTGVRDGWFAEGPVILTAGGSAYFDLVVERFRRAGSDGDGFDRDLRIVIRSGCYLTHDSRHYTALFAELVARAPDLAALGEGPRPALEVWAMVQSTPEPGLAHATLGKRDISYDIDPPAPLWWKREGRPVAPLAAGHEVFRLDDQHAHLRLPEGSPLGVGDYVGFGISHPCTTFDKWQLLYLVDDDYRVTGAIRTFF